MEAWSYIINKEQDNFSVVTQNIVNIYKFCVNKSDFLFHRENFQASRTQSVCAHSVGVRQVGENKLLEQKRYKVILYCSLQWHIQCDALWIKLPLNNLLFSF